MNTKPQGRPKVVVSLRERSAASVGVGRERTLFAQRLITRSVMATLDARSRVGVFGLILAVLLVVSADDMRGEAFPLANVVPHSVPEPLRPKLQKLARLHADALYTHLLLRTDEADRVCGLSDQQRERLTLAAKGAVQHAIDDWLASIDAEYAADPQGATSRELSARIATRIKARGLQIFRVHDDGRIIGRNAKGRVELRPGDYQILGDVILIGGEVIPLAGGLEQVAKRPANASELQSLDLDQADLLKSSIWRSALERILTATQRSDLRAVQIRRQFYSNQHDWQLDQAVKFIDEQLLLDADQRRQMVELCRKYLQTHKPTLEGATLNRRVMTSLDEKEIADLLSDRQLARWRELTSPRKTALTVRQKMMIRDAEIDVRKGADR